MGVTAMFLLLATITPFLLIQLKRPVFAVVQSVLLVGMWLYSFQIMFFTAPGAFSISWMMFYGSLIGAHVAWIMFIIALVEEKPATLQEN
ncbi:hypothetical protein [Virgibacillus sp. SK37]|uniref:hypothetical protein n=1 Tax=Virgibacillus sp. SK37 TaxID=403957 RepID=UPI0004D16227|nr:hypothetical protein [Virgibacillus sp. SK37]AIF42476.1 hypothetical protein X953_03670 [Virgibacillus sp. SK37]